MTDLGSNGQPVLPLAKLKPGQKGTIFAVHADEGLHRRLAALGLRVGRAVQVVRRARFGGPLHIRVGTTDLMVRSREAENIDVFGISG